MTSTNPVADADKFSDIMAALDNAQERERERFADDTRKAFADAYKGGMTMVEWVQYMNGPRIRGQTTRDAFLEELDHLGPQAALWEMLDKSTCPFVAKLKKAVEDSYIEQWAGDVAELRADV